MKKFLHSTLLFTAVAFCILLTPSCQKEEAEKPQWPLSQSSHTLMLYFMGTSLDNDFDNNIIAAKNALCELSSKGEPLSARAVKPRVLYFHHKESNREVGEIVELIYDGGQCAERTLATFSMPLIVTQEDMTNYLKQMIELAPADSYGLVIGTHGCGWIPIDAPGLNEASAPVRHQLSPNYLGTVAQSNQQGFVGEGYHPNFGTSVPEGVSNMFDTDELATILTGTGVKFEYTIYDVCLMANIEALYDLRHTSKYVVASVCEILGEGFPYQTVIPFLLSENGRGFDLDGVCQAFNTYYDDEYGCSGSISLIDCSQIDDLATITKRIIAESQNNLPDIEENSQKAALQGYDGNQIFYDFGQYINQLCIDESQKAEFNSQLGRTVVSKYTLKKFYSGIGWGGYYNINPDYYSGLSTTMPSPKYRQEYLQTAWYKATH